jgi:hypothetical protein
MKPKKGDYVRLEAWGDDWFLVHSIVRDKWIYLDDGVDYIAYCLAQDWIIKPDATSTKTGDEE